MRVAEAPKKLWRGNGLIAPNAAGIARCSASNIAPEQPRAEPAVSRIKSV
jgi:hypothetical protein